MNIKYKQIASPLVIGGLLLIGLLLLLNGPPLPARAAPGDVYCVTPGGGTYPACDQVFTTVQAAVDAASGGEEIRVAAGDYTGVQARPVPANYPNPPASGVITQALYISKTVTVRGGYAPPFTDPPDPETNPTTLDAQGEGRVILIVGGGISPIVEGLHITGGDAAGLSSSLGRGGGVYIMHATATISNSRVFSNTADRGGGLYLYNSDATLSGNTVTTNTASDEGGGLYLAQSDAMLSGNTISANTADDCGGGLYLSSDATLGDNTISANTADYRGGGLYLNQSAATFSNNTITANAAEHGGGLYLYRSAATLDNNFVTDNTLSQPSGLGSGLYVDYSSPHLRHNTVARNCTGGGQGQGLYVAGKTSQPQLHNTILVSHSVGISVAAGSARLEGTFWGGGAWANAADWSGDVATGTVNVWGDPAFVDPNAGDYHIGPSSAAVDAGAYPTLDSDFDGESRPAAFGPDIGADERPGPGLQTHKRASHAVRSPGEVVTYTLVVTGVGTGPVDDVVLVDRLPPEQRVVTSEVNTGVCAPLAGPVWGGGITCTLGTLNVGGSARVTLTAQVTTTLPSALPWPTRNSAWFTGAQAAGFAFADVHLQDCHVRLNDGPGEWDEVQTAVDASTQPTDVVKVAGYCAEVTSRAGMVQMIYLTKTLTLQGGWNTAFTQRDVVSYPTTLDALGQGRVLYIAPPIEGVGNITPTVEGLRIMGGDAGDQNGGGAYVINATATIKDNQVTDNIANAGGGLYLSYSAATLSGNTVSANSGVAGNGGGLFLNYSAATLNGNTVSANAAEDGGGLCLWYSAATLSNNTIISNTSSYRGGGLYLRYSNATLGGNTVSANTAGEGGGLYLMRSPATLNDSTVISNTAGSDGGGLYLSESDATLSNNTVISNTADSSGGGLYLRYSDATLNGNTVISNTAAGGWGGGLYLGSSAATLNSNTVISNAAGGYGGGLNLSYSAATLNSNTVSANTADRGGALYLQDSNATLTNIIVANNWVTDRGSGLCIMRSSPRLLHTTIARNSGGDGSGVYVYYGSTVALTNTILVSHMVGIEVTASCTATLESTLWHGNATDWDGMGAIFTGTHNTWGDPLFDADGYHLLDGSAAIDQGVDAGVTTDIDDETRPMGLGYDIGVDEFFVCAPLSGVSISGPTQGYTDTLYTFTAIVTPSVATPPFTYTWAPEPESGQGAGSAGYRWIVTGTQTITLTAESCGGGSDVATHAIEIGEQQDVYLPLVLRDL